jgi:hypothetical protein
VARIINDRYGGVQQRFCEDVDITRDALYKWSTGDRPVSLKMSEKIAATTGYNFDWIAFGKGPERGGAVVPEADLAFALRQYFVSVLALPSDLESRALAEYFLPPPKELLREITEVWRARLLEEAKVNTEKIVSMALETLKGLRTNAELEHPVTSYMLSLGDTMRFLVKTAKDVSEFRARRAHREPAFGVLDHSIAIGECVNGFGWVLAIDNKGNTKRVRAPEEVHRSLKQFQQAAYPIVASRSFGSPPAEVLPADGVPLPRGSQGAPSPSTLESDAGPPSPTGRTTRRDPSRGGNAHGTDH